MNLPKTICMLVSVLAEVIGSTASYAELSPTESLMKATKLTCTFTLEQQTRWGSSGPIKEEGGILSKVTFDAINHQTSQAKIPIKKRYLWQDDDEHIPVRIRVFTHSITFFELSEKGALDPVITTVLDDYYSGTTKFIAVRSTHWTSSFHRALVSQETGTCLPG